ncbi:hypothetical protein [Janibacter melonis]|uniref:hypothetical protein n=1 Tax=Janibacter melonis TaxID=262209 RepID=UPI0027D9F925|nr:hypothetical protein [Janibacter melonis]
MASTKSTCSWVAVTAASPGSSQGTQTDHSWAASPPAHARQVCVQLGLVERDVAAVEVVPGDLAVVPRRSL